MSTNSSQMCLWLAHHHAQFLSCTFFKDFYIFASNQACTQKQTRNTVMQADASNTYIIHVHCALCIYFMYIIPIPVLHRLVLFDRPAIMFPSPANKSLSLAPPLHAMSTLFNDHCPEDAEFVIFKIIF